MKLFTRLHAEPDELESYQGRWILMAISKRGNFYGRKDFDDKDSAERFLGERINRLKSEQKNYERLPISCHYSGEFQFYFDELISAFPIPIT